MSKAQTNVIALHVPNRRQQFHERAGAMAAVFASHRRDRDDVFWLKENAEVLNILECTGQRPDDAALAAWEPLVPDLMQRLVFFPQYYRFFLSIALDLEDLGLGDATAAQACAWVQREGLAEAELSDLQRAEARRLLARRDCTTAAADPHLDDRLRAFVSRSATYALPNKKAAYELTHIVFYLSEYGRRDPMLPEAAMLSLEYAGTLAYLEQNVDLLAEVCIALRYAGATPSPIWEACVMNGLARFAVEDDPAASLSDDYHEFLVSSWASAVAGETGRSAAVPTGRVTFHRAPMAAAPLRSLSKMLFDLGPSRSGDWQNMQHMLFARMEEPERDVLMAATQATVHFDSFFEGFARARA